MQIIDDAVRFVKDSKDINKIKSILTENYLNNSLLVNCLYFYDESNIGFPIAKDIKVKALYAAAEIVLKWVPNEA